MNRKAKITNILNENLDLYRCYITDVSKSHKGHSVRRPVLLLVVRWNQ